MSLLCRNYVCAQRRRRRRGTPGLQGWITNMINNALLYFSTAASTAQQHSREPTSLDEPGPVLSQQSQWKMVMVGVYEKKHRKGNEGMRGWADGLMAWVDEGKRGRTWTENKASGDGGFAWLPFQQMFVRLCGMLCPVRALPGGLMHCSPRLKGRRTVK